MSGFLLPFFLFFYLVFFLFLIYLDCNKINSSWSLPEENVEFRWNILSETWTNDHTECHIILISISKPFRWLSTSFPFLALFATHRFASTVVLKISWLFCFNTFWYNFNCTTEISFLLPCMFLSLIVLFSISFWVTFVPEY